MRHGLGSKQRLTLQSYTGSFQTNLFDFSKRSRQQATAIPKGVLANGRKELLGFTQLTKGDYHVNWHHRVLCQHLDRVLSGEIKKLMVFMPPQHGKSELVSRRFPAFAFGVNPDLRILSASYGHTLAAAMNRDVQRIIDSDEYRVIFPKTTLSGMRVRSTSEGAWLRNNDEFEIVGRKGYYRSTGVGGGLTGRAGDIAIIDDPFKDEKEASSATIRQSVWEWYSSTLLTRLSRDASIIIAMTRWNLDDLAGRLLATEPDEWTVLAFPAIAEDPLHELDPRQPGEALYPEYLDIPRLMKRKRTTPASQWEALYQQRPIPKGGQQFRPREWLKPEHYVKALPAGIKLAWYWDNAGTQDGGARTAGVFGGLHEGVFYVVMVRKGQWSAGGREAVKKASAVETFEKYGSRTVYVEQEPGSGGLEQYHATAKNLAGFKVIADRPSGDKEARAEPLAGQMEVGNVRVYVGEDGRADWLPDWLDELETFPKGRFKDQVDGTAALYNVLALGPTKKKGKITGFA